MEIKTSPNSIVCCPNGHYYNAGMHASCPICGAASVSPAGAGSAPAGYVPTQGPQAAGVPSFPPTETPMGGSPAGPASAPMGITGPVDVREVDGGQVSSMGVTLIGEDIKAGGQVDPVVGWLVCIDGPVRGTDYRLHAGYNYIGRVEGDIHIQGDNQISREKHASVSYYSPTKTFHVSPAEGRNIIVVNGKPIYNATQLNPYDVITVGTSLLLFVPLCGEHFSWETPEAKK